MNANERLHALDALRAVAMLLGVAGHAMVPYMTEVVALWPANDTSSSALFDVLFSLIRFGRMPIFFMIAGFFACMLLARYSWHEFMRHRLSRIGLPLLLGMVTIVPLCNLISIWGLRTQRAPIEDPWSFFLSFMDWYTSQPVLHFLKPWHLWFLEYLLVFYTAAMFWIAIATWRPLAWLGHSITGAWAWCLRFGVAAPVLALVTFPLLFLQYGPYVDGAGGPFPSPRILAFYAIFFAAGWMLYRRRDVLPALTRHWIWIPLVIIGVVAGVITFSMFPTFTEMPALSRLVSAITTAALVLGITGAFLCLYQRPNRVMRYISDSAYWVYLIHLPLVIAIAVLLQPFHLTAYAKFALVMLISTPIMYLSYQLMVRYTWIGVMLNGPRLRWRKLEAMRGATAGSK